jgi:apolipoprotein N-acyltransferase
MQQQFHSIPSPTAALTASSIASPRASFNRTDIGLLLLSGLLLGCAFPPLPFGVLAFVGFVPMLVVLERTRGAWQTLRRLYLVFFAFHGASNWWVSSWQREADPYLMAAGIALWLSHPLFFALPMLGYVFVRERAGRTAALAALPLLWTGFEWLHGVGELSYPWQSLGYTQIYHTPFVQIADVAGVWGLTFIIVVVNVCLAQMWFSFVSVAEQSTPKPLAERLVATLIRSRVQLVCAVACVLLPLIYGVTRLQHYDHATLITSQHLKQVTIGVIQPNVNPWGKWTGSAQSQVLHQMSIQDSLRLAVQQRGAIMDIALWSEVAIPYRILAPSNAAYFQALKTWVDTSQTALITGIPSDTIYASRTQAPASALAMPRSRDTVFFDSYNTTMLLSPRQNVVLNQALLLGGVGINGVDASSSKLYEGLQLYRKMKMTPLAERVPYADVLFFAVKALTWSVGISGWQLGPVQHCLGLPREDGSVTRIGTIICIESIYPNFVAGFVRAGAQILTVVTNDGWFNHTPGPEQHYQIAAMRAIETRRYLARCANTGVSGFITPTGTSLQTTQIATCLGIAATMPLLDEQTLYVRWGDWLPAACALAAVGMMVWAGWQAGSRLRS